MAKPPLVETAETLRTHAATGRVRTAQRRIHWDRVGISLVTHTLLLLLCAFAIAPLAWAISSAFKAAFGYHIYDHAQAADMLGERLEQLRSGRDREEPATDEFARLCEHVWHSGATIERLVAVYRVLEPHLVSTYAYHAEATDPLADAPTVLLLRHLAALDQSHVAWGQAVLESLTQSPEDRKRALAVLADLEARLVACGGVTGQGIESHWLVFHSARAAEKGRPRTKRGRSGYRYVKRCPPLDHPVVEAPFWFSDNLEDFRAAYNAADEWSLEGFRHKFHQLLYGEVETTDRMGKMLAEFPQLPWEMRMELAHQMWDEARHIEIVAKACEEDLGARLGYGPWSLVWWWMQNDPDPLKRIAVTNSWAEANLMHMLRLWWTHAEQRGYTRIAELADYLQADELTHVKLATRWIRQLTAHDPGYREELVRWGRKAVRAHRGLLRPAGRVRAALHVPQAGPRRARRQRERHHRRVGSGLLPTVRVRL